MPQDSLPWTLVVPTVHGWSGPLGTTWEELLATATAGGAEIVVVADLPEGRLHLPPSAGVAVRLVATGGGAGYAGACNAGLEVARGRRVLFLNDDVSVPEDLLEGLDAAWPDDPDVGAVVPDVFSERLGRSESGCRIASRHGLLDTVQDPLSEVTRPDYPCGAAVAMETDLIRRLGGWETLYAPGYWEDVDLGLTLRKAGLRVVPVPDLMVRHLHGRSMDALGSRRTRVLYERNRILCSAKHLQIGLPVFLTWALLRALAAVARDSAVVKGTISALMRIGRARSPVRTQRSRVGGGREGSAGGSSPAAC